MGQWLSHVLFCLQRLPISRLWMILNKPIPDYHTYETNNCWRVVDAHFQDWAVTVVGILFSTKDANMSVMHDRDQMRLSITIFTRQCIVDAPLMLRFGTSQWLWHFVFWLWWLPICWLCKTTAQESSHYFTYNPKNCWFTVHTHVRMGQWLCQVLFCL